MQQEILSQRSPRRQNILTQRNTLIQKTYTNVYTDINSINRSIIKAKDELRKILNDLLRGVLTIHYADKINNTCLLDFHRIISYWSRSSNIDHAVRNILLSCFFSAEVKQGGSGIIACMMFVGHVEKTSSNSRVQKKDVENLLTYWGSNGLATGIAKHAMAAGSNGCEVNVSEGTHFGSRVSVIAGHCINGNIDNLFASSLSENFEYSGKSHVLAIDGIVENISQIHRILEKANKQHVIIAANGFLPDVANTLSLNYKSGKLQVIPFVASDWGYENFLSLKNQNVTCASSIIGSELRNVKLEKEIDVFISTNKIIIQTPNSLNERKIKISLGRDLGKMTGLTLDRIKTLLAISRFSSRSGIMQVKFEKFTLPVAVSSYLSAKKSVKSIDKILQNLGAVITCDSRSQK